ncbi:MAG: hypothetical protein HY290_19730 [Planctomycetia bacterium]|nr:hypothetical protein [Planctomycetia bacterium]
MEVWQIVLYGVAALLAMRSLGSLMTSHRQRLYRQIEEREEEARLEEERLQAEAAALARRKARRPGAA